MNIAFGCDHGGFPLKEAVVSHVKTLGHTVVDCGAMALVSTDDYPDFAEQVGRVLQRGEAPRGILICGSGVGAGVAANKLHGVRAALCHDTFSARQGVEDDDMNILCLGARVIGDALARELVTAFLGATFSGAERHRRRLEKVLKLEAEQ